MLFIVKAISELSNSWLNPKEKVLTTLTSCIYVQTYLWSRCRELWKTTNPLCQADEKRRKVLRVGDNIKRVRWEGVWIEAAGPLGSCQNTGMYVWVFVWPERVTECFCGRSIVSAPSFSPSCTPPSHPSLSTPSHYAFFTLKWMINMPPSCVSLHFLSPVYPQCFVPSCSSPCIWTREPDTTTTIIILITIIIWEVKTLS